MLTPDYLEHVTDDIITLYSKLDQTIVRDIARRIVKVGHVTDTAAWQAGRAQESGLLYNEIIREVSNITGTSEKQVQTLFQDAGVQSTQYDAAIYKAAGLSPPPLHMSPSALQVLNAGILKTNGYLQNLTMTTASQAQQLYIQAAALAEMQVESGAFDYVTAIRHAVKSVSQEGAWVQYPSGHRDRLDVAVRRAVLTGVSQTTGEISIGYARDMGCDLMEITAHAGARPSHAVWQGRLVSLSGRPGYLTLTDIGYGTGAGFKGWNCRHDWYPYFEGMSESAYPRRELDRLNNAFVTYDGQNIPIYDATQIQRGMERKIRAVKRELAGYDAGCKEADPHLKRALKADFDTAAVKLKQQEKALKDFLAKTGLQKDFSRVQSAGFGRSQAQKAVQSLKRQLLPNAKNAVIHELKLTGYVLYKNHPSGRNKAVAFEKYLGYTVDNKNLLIHQVHEGLKYNTAKARAPTQYGQPYEVRMKIIGANGKYARIKTGWIIDKGSNIPRLTSIYVVE